MTAQGLVIASMWAAGLLGGVVGAVGLVHYGVAYLRLARARRQARGRRHAETAGNGA